MSDGLVERIEDASLNASAPPQQRWLDGWLVRFSPGKAKRARCVLPVAPGRMPLQRRLDLAAEVFRAASLPLIVRITPFAQPPGLDDELRARGFGQVDDTRVMVRPVLDASPLPPDPPGLRWTRLAPDAYAETIGALRGSPPAQRSAHAERLRLSPVPYEGWAYADGDGVVQACGQTAREAELVGLYDVFTRTESRGRGLAHQVCRRLLHQACASGAKVAYLQVEGDNAAARAIYHRLGFSDAYAYHYRVEPGATP